MKTDGFAGGEILRFEQSTGIFHIRGHRGYHT